MNSNETNIPNNNGEKETPHLTTNYHETRKGGQGPVWAVAPLIIINGEKGGFQAALVDDLAVAVLVYKE
jgi:hypothetical protein